MSKTTVLIVDDHPVILLSLQVMLEKEGYNVVGQTDSGIKALHLAKELKPQLIVLDIGMPDLSGLDVLKRLEASASTAKILVLSTQNPEHFAARCMRAGASGFVSKEHDVNDVIAAARAVMNGYSHFPQAIFQSPQLPGSSNETSLVKALSTRELGVLQLLTTGKTNKQIGDMLALSNKTVSSHKVSLMKKLDVDSLVDLINFSRRNGLV